MAVDITPLNSQIEGGVIENRHIIELQAAAVNLDANALVADESLNVAGEYNFEHTVTFYSHIVTQGPNDFQAGFTEECPIITPAADSGEASQISYGLHAVAVGPNTTDVNDWIVLPALSSVPVGHTITVVSNAAGHEVRTPATSNEKINNQDSDGTKEYAIAAGSQIHKFTKISNTIGWEAHGHTALGAAVTAVVPD